MPFPEIERIVYRNNPLTEVVCQLRFPPILSIESELPVKFQDAIREMYPSFQEKVELPLNNISNTKRFSWLFSFTGDEELRI
jgi:uncharacterized protein (TIGR04255 family)